MSGSEDEIYSTMFSSLKHPARRKILRMLAEKPLSFSHILDALDISSSHLTYHLDNLGVLVSKMEDGKYRLSSFGEAAVNTMKGVEEAPETRSNRLPSFSLKWKSLLTLLIIGIVLLASFSVIQHESLNQVSKNQQLLQNNLDQANTQNRQLLSWGTGSDKAISFIRDVAQIDLTKYQTTLISDTVQYRADLGGVLEEVVKYALTNNESLIDLTLRFRNNHFSKYQLNIDEGSPLYSQPQPTDVLTATKNLVERYNTYAQNLYLQDMNSLMANANSLGSNGTILNHTKLLVSTSIVSSQVYLMYTENGVDFAGKSLWLSFDDNLVTQLTDGWFLLTIGSTTINVSQEQAIQIAQDYLKSYSWSTNGVTVSNFTVLQTPASVQFSPHPREVPLALIPYWYVVLDLDRVYPGEVSRIAVGIWADTGEVANVQTLNG
jgi:DNA-binding transcriptional ArsR family regulator